MDKTQAFLDTGERGTVVGVSLAECALAESSDLLDVLGEIYQDGIDATRWPLLLDRLGQTFGTSGSALAIYRPAADIPFLIAHNLVEGLRGAILDRAFLSSLEHSHVTSLQEWDATTTYLSTWLAPGTTLAACAVLVLQFEAGRKDLQVAAQRVLTRLRPHIAKSVEHGIAEATRAFRTAELERETDCLPFGRVLLNASGRIVHANRAARVALKASDGLTIEREQVKAMRATDNFVLQQAIGRCMSGVDVPPKALLSIERRSVDHHYAVRVSPFRRLGPMALPDGEPTVELLISDAEHDLADVALVASCRHGFTKAARRVLECLLQGESIDECAKRLDLARGTARLHVAHMMKKTGAHRQADLVRRILAPLVVSPRELGIMEVDSPESSESSESQAFVRPAAPAISRQP